MNSNILHSIKLLEKLIVIHGACPTFVQKNHKLSVRRQCELLGVNRSAVYFTHQPVPAAKISMEEELMREIDRLHTELPCSGNRKLTAML